MVINKRRKIEKAVAILPTRAAMAAEQEKQRSPPIACGMHMCREQLGRWAKGRPVRENS
jgi:hypothetical protein